MKRGKTISGLTRIEYLCYIAIFGIMAFLTVPSLVFVKKVCASKDTIGKSIASSVIRAQQAYYEKHGRFMTCSGEVNKYWSEESKYMKAQNQLWDISIQTKSSTTFV